MYNHNIDIYDARINTKAPFVYTSKLRIGSSVLPDNAFVAIQIAISDASALPVHISSMQLSSDILTIEFSSILQGRLGTWRTGYKLSEHDNIEFISGYIYSDSGILIGHVTCLPDTPGTIAGYLQLAGGSVVISDTDFILLPQCCITAPEGSMRTIAIQDGSPSTADTIIDVGRYVLSSSDASYNITINAYGDITKLSNYIGVYPVIDADYRFIIYIGYKGLTTLKIKNHSESQPSITYIENKHLLIKSTLASNIRVLTSNNSISLSGVRDL